MLVIRATRCGSWVATTRVCSPASASSSPDLPSGGGGNDTLNGGAGSDIVSGDGGNDTLVYKMSENVRGITAAPGPTRCSSN